MDATPTNLRELQRYINILTQSRATLAACIGILLWEWLTQLSLEFQHIWRAPFRHTTIAFLLLRYFTFVSFSLTLWLFYWNGPDDTCQKLIYLTWAFPVVVHLLAQYLVIARMYALYDSNKLVLASLGTLTAAQVGIQGWLVSTLEATTLRPTGLQSLCICKGYKGNYWLFWGLPFVFDTVVLVLSLTKLVKLWKSDGRSRLVQLMIRDQVVWYAMTAILSTIYLGISFRSRNSPGVRGKGSVSFVLRAVTSLSVCRVILNLRKSVSNESTKSFSSLFENNNNNHGSAHVASLEDRHRQQGAASTSGGVVTIVPINWNNGLERKRSTSPLEPDTPDTLKEHGIPVHDGSDNDGDNRMSKVEKEGTLARRRPSVASL